MSFLLVVPSILCALVGTVLLIESFVDHLRGNDWMGQEKPEFEIKSAQYLGLGTLLVAIVLAIVAAFMTHGELSLFTFVDGIDFYLHVDGMGKFFVVVTSLIWGLIGVYATKYMHHEGNQKRFFGFYLLAYAVLVLLDFSGNLVTMYVCYEFMTITTMPLVLHNGSREAIMASLKYMFYSFAGAYGALFGIYFIYQNCESLDFMPGGTLNMTLAAENQTILLIAIFCMLLGFGAKAGMLPLHSWLPAAHPVAPAPASAALSSLIVKGGVLAIIRTVFYIVGPDFIRGSWVQYTWMTLTLITVFMGSMMAFREPVFKKRLAYSTVSQVSYILFGLSVLDETAMTGSLLHVAFHATIKSALFLTAGVFIFRTGYTRVEDYKAIGKKYPITLWAYTIASLGLIGIPPTAGFISKWYLAEGALQTDIGAFRYIGPAVLLISALLTAGYLLPISLRGFLPGEKDETIRETETLDRMSLAIVILAVGVVLLGIFPNPLKDALAGIASSLL